MLFKLVYRLFIAAVILLGLLLLASLVPIPGNIEVKIVQSGSMEPAIKTGALVVVKPQESYAVGDVVMFGEDTRTEVPTTHRIIADEVRSGVFYYTTQGDANEDPDPQPIMADEVIGKVVLDIPYLGYILDFAKKPFGFILLVGIPAAVVIFDEVLKIVKEARRLRREEDLPEQNNESDTAI